MGLDQVSSPNIYPGADPVKVTAWAFGFNRQFGSVYSVIKKFGFQHTSPDGFSTKLKTVEFSFGFSISVFGFNRINRNRLRSSSSNAELQKMSTSNNIYDSKSGLIKNSQGK
jgi:hypothetical protein